MDIVVVRMSGCLITPQLKRAVVCDPRPSVTKRSRVMPMCWSLMTATAISDGQLGFKKEQDRPACPDIMLAMRISAQQPKASNVKQLEKMRQLAYQQGFSLAGFRNFDRPLDPAVWTRVAKLKNTSNF